MGKIDHEDINESEKENFICKLFKKSIWKEDRNTKCQALKITFIYFIIGSLWILLSDKLVEFFVSNPDTRIIIAIVKGWAYVFITAIVIFMLIYNKMKEVIHSKEKIQDINAILEEEIEEKTQVESELNKVTERLQKYKILAENANDAMLFVDKQGNILEVNDAAIRIYGYSFEEFTKLSVFDLRCVKKDSKVIEQMEKADEAGIIFETIHYLKDGTPIQVEVSSQGTLIGDKRILLSIVRNISDRKKAEKEILYISYHDQLTGLYNRRYYEEEIRRINTENNIPITLIIADVNGLKLTNDAFGHKAGDMLLKKISNILIMNCPPNGIISRIGGDEFVILLPNTDEYKKEEVIKAIKSAINEEKSDNIILSISVGATVKRNKFEDIDEIFKKAEANMYRNKLTESSDMRRKTIDLIMNSLYKRSSIELFHGKKVSEISKQIAEALKFDKEQIEQIEIAGLMHDIGKISVSEDIINKPGTLNEDERREIKRHSEVGYQILRSVNEYNHIANYVLEHHERWDGKGYPKGIKGEEISIEGRILAVSNAFASMTSDKIYSTALSKEKAVEELIKNSGSQFDPKIVNIFVEELNK